MTNSYSCKAHYLDASCLVKLVVRETASDRIREFINIHTSFYTTPICFAEALTVLKRKWSRKEIDTEEYFDATGKLVFGKVEIEDIGLANPLVHGEVQLLAQKHTLDLSDALQLVTIRRGRNKVFGPDSASVLITADCSLAIAATSEGIRTWNCFTNPLPPWPSKLSAS